MRSSVKHPRVYHKYVDPQRFDHDIAAESRIKTYHECKSKNFKTSVLFSINPFNEHYCVSRATPVRCTGLMKTSLHLSQGSRTLLERRRRLSHMIMNTRRSRSEHPGRHNSNSSAIKRCHPCTYFLLRNRNKRIINLDGTGVTPVYCGEI